MQAIWPLCALLFTISCSAPQIDPQNISKELAEDLVVLDEMIEIVLADDFPKIKEDWSRYGREHRYRNVAH